MTALAHCLRYRLEKMQVEYVSKGVTLDEQLILAFEPEITAAASTIVFK